MLWKQTKFVEFGECIWVSIPNNHKVQIQPVNQSYAIKLVTPDSQGGVEKPLTRVDEFSEAVRQVNKFFESQYKEISFAS